MVVFLLPFFCIAFAGIFGCKGMLLSNVQLYIMPHSNQMFMQCFLPVKIQLSIVNLAVDRRLAVDWPLALLSGVTRQVEDTKSGALQIACV